MAARPASCHPERPHQARGLCKQCYRAAGFEKVDPELARRRKERHAAKHRVTEHSRYHRDPRVRARLKAKAQQQKGTPVKERMSPEAYARRLERQRRYYQANKALYQAHAAARERRIDGRAARRARENAWRQATGRVTMTRDEYAYVSSEWRADRIATAQAYLARRAAREEERRFIRAQAESRRRAREVEVPALHIGHEFFDRVRELVRGPWYGNVYYDPTGEDARSEAVLALLEGRDPQSAARDFRAKEKAWRAVTTEVPEWGWEKGWGQTRS